MRIVVGRTLESVDAEVLMRRRLFVSGLLVVGGLLAASLLESSSVGFWIGALVALSGVSVLVAGSSYAMHDYRVRGGQRARMVELLGKRRRPFE